VSPRRPIFATLLASTALAVAIVASGFTVPAVAEDGDVVIAGAGDIATAGTPGAGQLATAALLSTIAPDAVFAAGDTQYKSGLLADFQTSYDPTWGAFKPITVPAIGNHEWLDLDAAGWKTYFGRTETYYATTLGSWRVYVVDSNCSKVGGCGRASAQFLWLKNELTVNPAPCVLAMWHHPLFTSGGNHGPVNKMRAIWNLLDNKGGDVVLTGHAHNYERFGLQDRLGVADPAGMREFVVGTGGAEQHGFIPVPYPNSEIRLKTDGVLSMTLGAAGYTWSFLGTDGSTLDAGTGTC
jgi:hypothetical protein